MHVWFRPDLLLKRHLETLAVVHCPFTHEATVTTLDLQGIIQVPITRSVAVHLLTHVLPLGS